MDFSLDSLDGLGQAERLRLCRQLRNRQVENYLAFQAREQQLQPMPARPLPRKPNRRDTVVHFHKDVCLQTAVEQMDEREVMRYLQDGSDFNFSTGNGTSLLHKCCAEGNFPMAELLVLKGAKVNSTDDDWWTPLHVACYQDHSDIVQLLLTNGADVSMMDVDGNFPIDHAPQHTDTWDYIISFMESQSLSETRVKKLRQQRCHQMEDDVKAMIRTAQNVNTVTSEDGVTMLHMAAANGYVKCGKLLLKQGADVTSRTRSSGWTALHCAAKFGQVKMVELLAEFGADVNAIDKGGNKAIDLAAGEEMQKALLEARAAARRSALLAEGKDEGAVSTDDEDVATTKIVRPSNLPLSKADRLMEGQMLLQARALPPPPPSSKPPPRGKGRGKGVGGSQQRGDRAAPGSGDIAGHGHQNHDHNDDDEDDRNDYEEIFATTIYSTAETEQGQLPEPCPQDDLSSLPSLSERLILDNLRQRYRDKRIYTYMGDVLIAVNPFIDLSIYGKWASKIYRESTSMTSLSPHVYAIAEHAQRVMRSSGTNQCCVISGESGAGKTETSKLLVQHLMCAASASERQLNSKLHQINPLLEAFGNAQTVMNNNSSRFAKYLELVFAPDGCVLGGRLNQYLLEKCRVVQQGPHEGNFHIFSWLLQGATPEERARCMLDKSSYRFLQSGPGTGLSNAQQKLLEVKDCMKFVGFSHDDVNNMVSTVAAVLHLGEITFQDGGDQHPVTIANPGVLRKVCSLLRVPYEDLASALTEDVLTARGEELRKPLTVSQSWDNVQAVSKALYSRLFAWIVNGINQMVAPLDDQSGGNKFSIGILDIFGFENLQSNGFEQMCINIANERLQQFYQAQVFERERQECVSEGVPPVDVVFPSSQQVLDLFTQKNIGVYDLLDEESTFPKASDDTLATKLHYHLGKKHEQVYKMPRYGGTVFTVLHYAGAVQYDLRGVIEKNRDTLRNALAFVMRSSESLLVKELFQSALTKTGSITPSARQRVSRKMKPSKSPFDFFKKLRGVSKQQPEKQRGNRKGGNYAAMTASRKSPCTLTFHFKNSLREMVSKLEASAPHFIRCIKPNPTGAPLHADADYVAAQLKYSGILQTAILRKEGYAVRTLFQNFLDSYPALALFHGGGQLDPAATYDVKGCVVKIMTTFGIPHTQVGSTKVFLGLKQVQRLEEYDAGLISQIVTAQTAVRRLLAKRFVDKRRRAREEYRRQREVQRQMEEAEAERKKREREEEEEEEQDRRRKAAEEEATKQREEGGERERDTGRQEGGEKTDEEAEKEKEEEGGVLRRGHKSNLTRVPAEVRQSLEFLDSVISEYSLGLPWSPDRSFDSGDRSEDDTRGDDEDYRDCASTNINDNEDDEDDDDDNYYKDATSLLPEQLGSAEEMHRNKKKSQHHHHPHHQQSPHPPPGSQYPNLHHHHPPPPPCHPHDLPMDPSGRTSFLPSPREMYASHPMAFNHATANGHQNSAGCAKRVPPQVPERSPDTHLSSSRKSSISSKDSCSSLDLCNELNEVFEANPHLHHHPHHYDPANPTSPSANRYADSRPFSYAAGIDPKALQQRQHVANTNVNAHNSAGAKSRAVSEVYPPLSGDAVYVTQSELAARGYQVYGDQRRVDDRTPSTSSSSQGSSVNGAYHHQQEDCYNAIKGVSQHDPYMGGYGTSLATASRQAPQQTVQGGYQYPAPPVHAQPPPPPPPTQMHGAQRVPQAPGGGVALPGGLGSPRHVHTHHHIVTKPHPSPPASRRGSSSTSPGRSRSPGSSAFQPVAASASPSTSSAPSSSSSSSQVHQTSYSSSSSSSTGPPPPPPTFPAPPPPLPLHDRYLAATQETRSPSPPLPPPPTELKTASNARAAAAAQGRPPSSGMGMAGVQPPAPPGAAVIPGNNKGHHQSRSENRRVVVPQSPGRGPTTQSDHAPPGHQDNRAMLAELGQAKLKKAEPADNGARQVQQHAERSQSPLGVRLKPTNGKFSNIYREQDQNEAADVVEELPPPPLPDPDDLPPPPPSQPQNAVTHPGVAAAPPSSLTVTSVDPLPESQLVAALSRMEIEIPDDIDISQCPGLVEITRATPNWKREMIEKKNRDKIEEYVKQILKEREQAAKWRNVPEWKRALLMKKDQEEQEAALAAMNNQAKKAPPTPSKGGPGGGGEVPPCTMPKPRGDIVPAALSIDPAELEGMPPWKRELLFKREKVPITFSNEFNPDEEEGEGGGEGGEYQS